MSSTTDKIAATTDFLRNRASLNRRTTLQELGTVVGEVLAQRGQRGVSTPVRREKFDKVLLAVDKQSFKDNGILLSALVTHFWDNKPTHRFYDNAAALGLNVGSDPEAFHKEQLRKVCAAYPDFVHVSTSPVIPDDISELDDDEEDADIY